MAKFIIFALGAGALATTVFAAGTVEMTLEEIQAAHPEITAEDFQKMDTNQDGKLDSAEMKAAEETGELPTAKQD